MDFNALPTEKISSKPPAKKVKGFALTALLFQELSKELSAQGIEEFTAADLMKAAQHLIKISRGEYVDKISKEYAGKSHYYTLNLCSAFEKHLWQIASVETHIIEHCDYAEYSDETLDDFRSANLCLGDLIWEF